MTIISAKTDNAFLVGTGAGLQLEDEYSQLKAPRSLFTQHFLDIPASIMHSLKTRSSPGTLRYGNISRVGAALTFVLTMVVASGLPAQTDDSYDKLIDEFIRYDIGELQNERGRRAYEAFINLDNEKAIPALVRGVNRSARIMNSCPIVIVANKLQTMLASSKNEELLRYALENLNHKGPNVHYAAYVQSLLEMADQRLAKVTGGKPKFVSELRGGTVSQLRRITTPPEQWSFEDLVEGAVQDKDSQLVRVLEQLQQRPGAQHTEAFANAIASISENMKPLARGLLAQRLARMTEATLKAALTNEHDEIRAAAAKAIGYKGTPLCRELGTAVRDKSPLVCTEAHASLVKLTGKDLGPADNATLAERFAASQRWEKVLP